MTMILGEYPLSADWTFRLAIRRLRNSVRAHRLSRRNRDELLMLDLRRLDDIGLSEGARIAMLQRF